MGAAENQDESRLRLLSELIEAVSDPSIAIEGTLARVCQRTGELLADTCVLSLATADAGEFVESARWSRTEAGAIDPVGDRMAVAIGSDEPLGRIVLQRSGADGPPFSADDVRIVEDVARLAAIAIQNARFLASFQAAAESRRRAEAERDETQQLLDRTEQLESMGRLAGAVAHDFNNLLAVMVSSSAVLMASTPPDDRAAPQLAAIRTAADRAAELTRQLLAFSRQQVLAPRTIDPAVLLADLERMIRPVIGEDVELTVDTQPLQWRIHADRSQLDLVLVNLVVNARDAMPRGGRLAIAADEITLDCEDARRFAELRPGDYVRFVITDTGNGIAPEIRDRVFEPFFTTKDRRGGTGLGLPTALGIVRQSGGDMRFDTEVGSGTTFEVMIPRHVGARAR